MKQASIFTFSVLLALSAIACGKGDGAGSGSSGAQITGKPPAKTRVEKVTMNGVRWEVTLPVDMKAPQYKVNNPEYLGDDEVSLALDGSAPVFSTVEEYIQSNVTTRVLEKKQVGEAVLLVTAPQAHNAHKILMAAVVPGKTIGWRCSGSKLREADVRAMCQSVRFARE